MPPEFHTYWVAVFTRQLASDSDIKHLHQDGGTLPERIWSRTTAAFFFATVGSELRREGQGNDSEELRPFEIAA